MANRIEIRKTISAVDLQREYLHFVQSFITEHDEETEWVLSAWESILDDLEDDWQNVITRVDWAAKKWLLEAFIQEENLDWDDPWIKSQDLEYHNIDMQSGLYYALQEQGQVERVITDQQIEHAIENAPQDTRAKVRSFLMRTLTQNRMPCIVDWHQIYAGHTEYFEMKEPFDTISRSTEMDQKSSEATRPKLGRLIFLQGVSLDGAIPTAGAISKLCY